MEFPLTWKSWKTPGILLLTWNFWHKPIYAGFNIVKAVVSVVHKKLICFMKGYTVKLSVGEYRVCGYRHMENKVLCIFSAFLYNI